MNRRKKSIVITQLPGKDAYSRILAHLKNPARISLRSQEELIYERWSFCNRQLKERKLGEEKIIDLIAERFEVSKATARADIGYTQSLFVEVKEASKQYLLRHHIEDIGLTIQQYKMDKQLSPLIPKLMEAYTRALAILPDTIAGGAPGAPIISITVINGQSIGATMPLEEAKQLAMNIIASEKESEFIDYEDLK